MTVPTNDKPSDLAETVSVSPGVLSPRKSTTDRAAENGVAFRLAGVGRTTRSWRNWRVYLFAGVVLMAAFVRLVNLGQAPPFIDEDGYSTFAHNVGTLTWQQVVFHPELLTPLTGDKPPLAILLQERVNRLVGDIVVAGRLLSVVAGVATTILCFFLGRKLGGNDVGLVSMAVYAWSPLAVLHERMVLQDPLMSACSLAAVLLAWTAIQRGSLRFAAASAVLGALSVQFKVPGLATAPLVLVLIATADRAHRKYWYLAVIAAAGAVLSYALLMIGPGHASLQDQNQRLLAPLKDVGANVEVLRAAVAAYLPWGVPILGLVGMAAAVRLKRSGGLICVLAIVGWTAPWIILSNFAPSRYYLPAVPYLCGLIGLGAVWMVSLAGRVGAVGRTVAGCGVATILAASVVTSAHFATNFVTAPLSGPDDCQYRSCWPSGYGYRAAHDFVVSAIPAGSRVAYRIDIDHRIALGLDRQLPAGVDSMGVVKPGATLPVDSSDQPLYVVVDDARYADPGTGLRALLAQYPQFKLVAQFLRPGSTGGVSIVRSP